MGLSVRTYQIMQHATPIDSCFNSHRRETKCRYICPYANHEGTWRSGGIAPLILNTGTRWGEWSASRLGSFTLEERCRGTHWTWGWVGPRAGPEHLPSVELLFRRPVRDLVTVSTELSRISVTDVRTWNYPGTSFEGNRKTTAFIHVLLMFPSALYNMILGTTLLLKLKNELFWTNIFFSCGAAAQRESWPPHSSGF